jgi:Cu/Ag efflux protein CusF
MSVHSDQPLASSEPRGENLHNFHAGDPNQAGATNAWHSELQNTLAPADQMHSAWASVIGAKPDANAAPTGETKIDAATQKANTEALSMASVGMGDMTHSAALGDSKAVGEQFAQKSRENAQAGSAQSVAFDNVFKDLGNPQKSAANHSGFPGSDAYGGGKAKGNGLFAPGSSGFDMTSARPLDTKGTNSPQLAWTRAA